MKNKQLIILLGIFAVIIITMAFRPNATKPSYSYLAIRAYHYDLDEVYISIGGKEYKKINLKKQHQGGYDINPLINLINQYENEGWEMQTIAGEVGSLFVWMRREK